MEIIVLGAGAIGSLLGAKLAAQNEVTLVGRAEHVAAINSLGLRIEGLEPDVVRVKAATSVQNIGQDALVVLTTKVTETDAALRPVSSLMRDDITILCLQNGLGSEQIARQAVANHGVVLRGITQLGAIFKQPGIIQFMARGRTLIEQHDRSLAIASVLNAAGLECSVSPDIRTDIWRKLIINCVVNPITAILGSEVGSIANPQLAPLKKLVIEECITVARAEGFKLDTDFLQQIDDFFGPSHNLASMLQDLRRGRVTEVDYLNGAVAALGARHGIDCPVNASLTTIIKAMEVTAASSRST